MTNRYNEKQLCERCLDEVGKERWVTDEIWCKTHYEMWLLEWWSPELGDHIGDEAEYARLEARL